MKYFKPKEFKCKCGKCDKGYADMIPDFMIKLDAARYYAGIQFNLTSAIRCHEHNANIGSSMTSSHLSGYAVDIECLNSSYRFHICDGLMKAGFNRIGIGDNFFHVDADPGKTAKKIWGYA